MLTCLGLRFNSSSYFSWIYTQSVCCLQLHAEKAYELIQGKVTH